jgi:glycosyltransferase involved in cell wall biosynthesis
MNKLPVKVSIVTITYNQENYIREALESFVIQKTNFPFEVIIADDCSTDDTVRIIEEYAEKYPTIIKPILRKKNIGAVANSIESLKAAKGHYIALCEGDDYWTDESKLQKQVDFLEANKKYDVCFHKTRVIFEGGEEETVEYPFRTDNFSVADLIEGNFIQTNSVMYRRQEYSGLSNKVFPFDWYLHLYHAQTGGIGYINETMSVYRRHAGGMWWIAYQDFDEAWLKYWSEFMCFQTELLRMFGTNPILKQKIEDKVYGTIQEFIATDKRKKSDIFGSAMARFPEFSKLFSVRIMAELNATKASLNEAALNNEDHNKTIIEATSRLAVITENLSRLQLDNDQLRAKIGLIEKSKLWRARNKIAKVLNR